MQQSKHNIISRIADSDNYFIVNMLSQEADILSSEEYVEFMNGGQNNNHVFVEKGYLVDPDDEDKFYRRKYLEFLDTRDTDEIQIFFVPTYACNFTCSYCYQDEYGIKSVMPKKELVDAFFNYIDTKFISRNKYITVFGGEPLLDTPANREFLLYFIQEANKRKLDLAFVSNGYTLSEFIPLLKTARIRELQITLDGTGEAHDKRRMYKKTGKSFDKIVEGIDEALREGLNINLRMVVDKENVSELPKLAQFAIHKGWTASPLFKTQLGRNYELHYCQSGSGKLYSRIEMYKDIYELLKTNPYITEFHKPAFSVSKFLFEEGTLPGALYDSCPGTKTEWAFDFSGKIFSCTATVGKPGEALGSFYPEVTINEDQVEEWQDRDVLSIEKCRSCELQLACGGGCASVAKNITGKVKSPDCRPIRELLELGISHYFS